MPRLPNESASLRRRISSDAGKSPSRLGTLALLLGCWVLPVIGATLMSQALYAGTFTWNQTADGTGYSWITPAYWNPSGIPNAIDDIANLNDISGNQTISLNQVITLGTLNIGDLDGSNTFTLAAGTGGYLILDGSSGASINKSGGVNDTISAGIQFNDGFSISNSGAGLLTLSGALRSVSSNITFSGTGSTTVSAAIVTAGNLVKNGSGTLTLGVASTYAGSTTVNEGTLALNIASALPARSAVIVAAGATLDYLNLANSIGSLSGAGNVTSSTASAARILTIGRDDTSTIFSGQFVPATAAYLAITKIGAGTLTLQPTGTNASTYTGNTIINGGTIALDTSASSLTSGFLGATPLQITGGNFQMIGRSGATVSQTLGAFTLGATGGSITLTANGGTGTDLTTGALTATASGGALLITAPATTQFKIGTAIASTALNGRLVFNDGTANTFNWAWNNNSATTAMSGYTAYTALPTTGGATNTAYQLTAGQTQTGVTTIGTLKLGSSGGSTQTLDLSTFNMTLGGGSTSAPGAILIDGTDDWNITSSGGALQANAGGDLIFQQFNTTNGVTVSAGIANGSAATNLVKAGPGLLTLAGTNTFTGTVFVDGGTLSFSSVAAGGAGSLGNGGSATAVTIRDGATLQYTGSIGAIAASGTGGHTYVLQGGNANIEVTASGQALTLGGAISGAGGFTKLGAGTLVLGATGTYTGPTFINAGTLKMGDGISGITSSSPVTINASGTLDINGSASSQTLTVGSIAGSGTILNSGGSGKTFSVGGDNTSTTFSGTFGAGTSAGNVLTKTGSGILTLANITTSAWTGGNNVNGGVLRLATSNALSATGTMNISLAAGPAQLEINPGVTQTLAALTFYGSGSTTTSQGNVLIGSGGAMILGGTLTVSASGNALGALIWGDGNLTLSGTRSFDIRDSSSVPSGSPELTISASINGAGGLTKTGPGTLLLTGANSYSGTTTLSIGSVILDYSTDNTSKIGTGALATGGGALILNGNASTATTQTVTGTTASAGSSTITLNSGAGTQAVTLGFGGFTRTAGTHTGTLRLITPAVGGFTTSTANTNGILGGWLTMTSGGATTFVANDGSGNIVALASTVADDVANWVTNDNVTDATGYTGTAAGPTFSINSIRFNAPGATSTVTIGNNNVLRVVSGGILDTTNVGAGTTSITGGYLASGTGNELIITQDNTGAPLTVSSRLIGATAITKSGAGTLTLSGNGNGFTGAVILQAGTLQVTGGSAFGDTSALTLVNDPSNPTFSLAAGQAETIGTLSGGGTYGGTVNIGTGSSLTINETAATTYSGFFTGSGTLVKTGTGTLTYQGLAPSFTGTVVINQGRFLMSGSGVGTMQGVSSFILNGGELYDVQDQSGSQNRILDTATITLNNTAGGFGLYLNASYNGGRSDTVGSIALGAGQNVITLDGSGGTSAVGTLTAGTLSRSNNATALVRGRSLGAGKQSAGTSHVHHRTRWPPWRRRRCGHHDDQHLSLPHWRIHQWNASCLESGEHFRHKYHGRPASSQHQHGIHTERGRLQRNGGIDGE